LGRGERSNINTLGERRTAVRPQNVKQGGKKKGAVVRKKEQGKMKDI